MEELLDNGVVEAVESEKIDLQDDLQELHSNCLMSNEAKIDIEQQQHQLGEVDDESIDEPDCQTLLDDYDTEEVERNDPTPVQSQPMRPPAQSIQNGIIKNDKVYHPNPFPPPPMMNQQQQQQQQQQQHVQQTQQQTPQPGLNPLSQHFQPQSHIQQQAYYQQQMLQAIQMHGNPNGIHPMQAQPQRMNFIPPQWGYVDPNHFFNQHQFNKVRNLNQGVRMPFPSGPKPPPVQVAPPVNHQYGELEDKMSRINLQGPIPTEPINFVESPSSHQQPDFQQKAKFEEIFKSLDQISSNSNNAQNQPKMRNGALGSNGGIREQPNGTRADQSQQEEDVWQLQKKFDQKPPTPPPPPRPTIPQVPGPCDPEDLVDGVLFAANYLGSTQLLVDKNSTKTARMMQAQEAMTRVKAPAGESQPSVEVDLFASTSKVKILNADTQDIIMEHPLRTLGYIADIGDILVLIAKRKETDDARPLVSACGKPQQRVICHVLQSPEAEMMSSALGQAFQLAFQIFLQQNGIPAPPENEASQEIAEMYHDDLVHYSKRENAKEVWIEKKRGEPLGVALVESGWGSILPTVILANIQHSSPAERSGKLNIGDQIMSINGTSLVGLPLSTVHTVIKGVKQERCVRMNIVSCPPVVTVIIKRPDLRHQLGFSVQNGIICSLMRGGIAEKGGVRVGHRIIEINNESVVATQHDKIVHLLVTSVGEIHMKTMPAAMFRLLTGQDQPLYL